MSQAPIPPSSEHAVNVSRVLPDSHEIVHNHESSDQSILGIYLNEIGKYRRISPEEEVALAKRIHKGEEEAVQVLVQANLRLVVKIAQNYSHFGMPLMDLISEGNIGLMKAARRFDPEKGGKLSTYAAWWIKQAIKRAFANQNKTIRLPVHMVEKLSHIRRMSHQLESELGREPTNDEIGQAVRIPSSKVAHLRDMGMTPASLDANVGEDDSSVLGDFVRDENALTAEEDINKRAMSSGINESMATLSDRERFILSLRFGLGSEESQTLDVISIRLGISKERVRQIQEEALMKIRHLIEGNA
jgi:RNA polymerase primary sigma factor